MRDAERDRLAARTDLVRNAEQGQAALRENRFLLSVFESVKLVEGDSVNNRVTLERAVGSVSGIAGAVILGRSGERLEAVPAGLDLDVAALGSAWTEALQGRRSDFPIVMHEGMPAGVVLLPVAGDRPWGAIAVVVPAATSIPQDYHRRIGSMNEHPGGLVTYDHSGMAVYSWDPAQIGRRGPDQSFVAGLPAGDPIPSTFSRDGVEWTRIAMRTPPGSAIAFEQATADLYRDLREAQRVRDLTLVGVLASAFAALALFQFARLRRAVRAQRRLDALLENSQDLVLVAQADGTLTFVGPSLTRLLGRVPTSWAGRRLPDLVDPSDRDRLQRLLDDPESGPLHNVRLADAKGVDHWFDIEATDHSRSRLIGGVLLTAHDVGPRKALEDVIRFEAGHDSLTGLANRTRFVDHLESLEALVADRQPGHGFALLYLDLDHFKPVNDTMGHDAGDQLLVTLADRMRTIVGERGLIARFGGDEFGIVLDDTGLAEAELIAQQLLDAVRRPVAIAMKQCQVDASIGMALADPGSPVPHAGELIRQADRAMYLAKRAGRGRYLVFRPEPGAGIPDRESFITEPDQNPVARRDNTDPAERHERDSGTVVETADQDTAPSPLAVGHAQQSQIRLRAWVARQLPLAAALAFVAGVAVAGQIQAMSARNASEALRLADASARTLKTAEFVNRQADNAAATSLISSLPWTLTGSPTDQAWVDVISKVPLVGAGSVVVLATTDGRTLAASPVGTQLAFGPETPAWPGTREDRVGSIAIMRDSDQPRAYGIIPIRRNDVTVAVLAVGTPVERGSAQYHVKATGATSLGGGFSIINADGIASASWDPKLVGEQIVDPADVAALPLDSVVSVRGRPGQLALAVATQPATMNNKGYLVFTTPVDAFFGDLHNGSAKSDLALGAAVLATALLLFLVHRRSESDARSTEERLDALLQHTHDVVIVVDEHGTPSLVSSAITPLLGYTPTEIIDAAALTWIHPDSRDALTAMFSRLLTDGHSSVSDIQALDATGNTHWFDVDAADLRALPAVNGLLLTCHDVTARRDVTEQLAQQARRDPLTGLPNRAELTREMERLGGPGGNPFAVLFIDLDHFKPINDTLGHDAGDRALITVAERLECSVRQGTDGRPHDIVCRIGGDEFAILLNEVDESLARATADRVLTLLHAPIAIGADTVHLGATIGIALSHINDANPNAVVRHADTAMYLAKQAGRNRYQVYQPA